MQINKIDIGDFGARLLDFTVSETQTTVNYFAAKSSFYPALLGVDYGFRTMILTLDFRAESEFTSAALRSGFAVQLRGVAELDMPDEYSYACILQNTPEPVRIMHGWYTAEYEFICIRHLPEKPFYLTGSGSHYCDGTANVRYRMEFTAPKSISLETFAQIEIKNITKGDFIAIDGCKGKISCNGENKFKDTNLIAFPTLSPGKNYISLPDGWTVNFRYTPILL